jgi:type I restriction enzyme S subunit
MEWATEVPSHWRVGNIRRFASMKTGHTPSRQHPEYWADCDIPWFTLSDVWQLRRGQRDMRETSEKISALGLANSAAELLPAGTVALSRTASVGFAGVMPMEMATSQDFWNWVPRRELLSEFLWFQFQAMKPEFERLMTGSTHRTIYQADAASFTIIVPPVSEQREIVERLDRVTRHIDAAIAIARRGIELARERRAALISAAVTGKIDVGVAA